MIQESPDEQVISFTCDHCKISLTVDRSLAGVTGPCPSCGRSITAPLFDGSEKSPSIEQPATKDFHDEGTQRKAGGKESSSDVHAEVGRRRSDVATVAKMLVLGVLVLLVILVGVYLLKQRF